MLKPKLCQVLYWVLIFCMVSIPVQAEENVTVNQIYEQVIVQPYFTNIVLFQNGYDIGAMGKASVSVYLTARNVDSVKVDANLQQYKNGSWTTIKSWTNTAIGTNAGLSGTYYVAKGYSYRLVSKGTVYKNENEVEATSFVSDYKDY